MIADYHSITEDYDPKTKSAQVLELVADFLAVGLDPDKSTIFLQSLIPEHTELAWIFSTVTPVAELTRMTQYKDKASRQTKNINAGLFTYPILQAVDILIYKPELVPVGHDQLQHLELANDIVRRFNKKFGQTFKEIKPLLTQSPRVMSLGDPQKKMSKSDPSGCLFLSDEPGEIKKKIQKAVASSQGLEGVGLPAGNQDAILSKIEEAYQNNPALQGGLNLFLLLVIFDYEAALKIIKNKKYRYSEIKEVLAEALSNHLEYFRMKKKELIQNPNILKETLVGGSAHARKFASATLTEVKQKIGLTL